MYQSLEMSQYLALIGSSLSFGFNVFLLYLIYRFSRPEYGSYRFLMMVMTSLYVVYSAIEVVVLPSYYIYEYNYLLFTTNIIEEQNLSQILINVFCAIFGCIQMVLAFQFVYRYLLSQRLRVGAAPLARDSQHLSVADHTNIRRRFFTGKRHIAWMSCTLVFFLNWFTVAELVFSNHGAYPKELEESVNRRFGRNMSGMAFTLVTYAQLNDDGAVEWRTVDVCMILYLVFCASIPMTISFVCGLLTWIKIHQAAVSVQKSFRLQRQERQLFFALLIQFSVPFLGNTLPMLVLFVCPALHVSTEPFTNYICMLIPYYPIFDATATICIIRDYYRGALKLFGLSRFAQSSSTAADGAQVPPNSVFTQSAGNALDIEMK